jgi:methanogenic corrinoid protein MtbC1/DNA-binding transcriptional MerR regulator
MDKMEVGYRTKTICELTGVQRNTLLAWERRYDFLEPRRAANGYRSYTERDLAMVRAVKAYVDRGIAVSVAVAQVVSEGHPSESFGDVSTESRKGMHSALLEPLLVFDRVAAERVIRGSDGLSYDYLMTELFAPVLRELGAGWLEGRYSIAQEHFGSAFVRDQLIAVLLRLDSGSQNGRTVVCACAPGDQHELGLLMVAIRLAMRGWRITWLGARMPEHDLIEVLNQYPPDLVCISATFVESPNDVTSFAQRVRDQIPDSVEFILGGPAVPKGFDVPGVQVNGTLSAQ